MDFPGGLPRTGHHAALHRSNPELDNVVVSNVGGPREEHPGLDQRGKRFGDRASRFIPGPSRQIQGFVKRRFALHVWQRVSERAQEATLALKTGPLLSRVF